MKWANKFASFFSNLFRQRHLDRELDSDVDGYLDLLVEEKLNAGFSPAEARRQALLEMGGPTQVKERTRQARSGSLLLSFLQDLRYARRMLLKKPSFTVFALLSLAVGIGVNTAIFSLVNVVLLEPLPYEHPRQLAIVYSVFPGAGVSRAPASGPELDELRKRSLLFQEFGATWVGSGALTGEGEPEQIKIGQVTANFFSVLGARAALGRTFLPEEEGGRGQGVVLLSDGLWRRRYGADPQIVGKIFRTAAGAFTVVGVMPHGFEVIFPADAGVPPDTQAWVPFAYPIEQNPRDLGYLHVIGRMRPGVNIAQAQAELDAISRDLRAQFREFSEQQLEHLAVPLQVDAVKEVRAPLLALFAGVGLVLLLSCANVANLLLARAGERAREMTMRSALGATRFRIIRQLMTESFLLAMLGGAAGLTVAAVLLKALPVLWPRVVPRLADVTLDGPTLLFTAGLSVLTGVIFGLTPALASSSVNLVESLKEAGRNFVGGHRKLRRLLVLAEVTLAFVLLTGAGLMLRTFVRLLQVDPGFHSPDVLTFAISPPGRRYPDDVKIIELLQQLEKNLAALPGVQSVGSTSHLPFDDYGNWYSYYFPEGTAKDQQKTTMADHRSVSPSLFRTLQVPLLTGRYFTEADDAQHPRVVIVDDLLAQRTWPGQSALGKKLSTETMQNGEFKQEWSEVVGVVQHVLYHSLMRQVRPQVYLPYMQSTRGNMQMSFVVRTEGSTESLLPEVRQAVAQLDKDLPVSKVRALDALVAVARIRTRFVSLLSGLLAMISMLLACIGIYGVTSCSVRHATTEIGVRMALGAHRADILRMFLRQSMVYIALGVALGAICSAPLAPLLSSLLFQVKPLDALTFTVVIATLLAVGLLACLLPATRASRMDPMAALRYE
ncbi:MAG TPA: ABC transporter permease [Candidatus Angelobacter sp.]